ncbi:MAG: hypothetical protein JSS76_07390 [Bacteroidetes bacterium]|nr:hypothetical protein [Bacteroidota bacterium]
MTRLLSLKTLALAGVALLLIAAGDGSNLKLWDPANKLTWADYRDTALTGSKIRAAMTNSGIVFSVRQQDEDVIVTCYAQMDRDKSFVDTAKKLPRILQHEQYHFNITEYWSRKLKKDIATGHFTVKNFKQKAIDLQQDANTKCKEMQVEYDTETKHSILKDEQKKWEQKVDELLKKTEQYGDKKVALTLGS